MAKIPLAPKPVYNPKTGKLEGWAQGKGSKTTKGKQSKKAQKTKP